MLIWLIWAMFDLQIKPRMRIAISSVEDFLYQTPAASKRSTNLLLLSGALMLSCGQNVKVTPKEHMVTSKQINKSTLKEQRFRLQQDNQ